MKGTIEWFARNGVAANLMMVFIVVTGIAATTTVREEIFPEIELDRITIEVPYLGAAPEEVEQAVNIRIEEAIQGTDGIKQIQSTASEGMGTVVVISRRNLQGLQSAPGFRSRIHDGIRRLLL